MMARATGMGPDVERHVLVFGWCVQALVEETLVGARQRSLLLDGSLAFWLTVLQN